MHCTLTITGGGEESGQGGGQEEHGQRAGAKHQNGDTRRAGTGNLSVIYDVCLSTNKVTVVSVVSAGAKAVTYFATNWYTTLLSHKHHCTKLHSSLHHFTTRYTTLYTNLYTQDAIRDMRHQNDIEMDAEEQKMAKNIREKSKEGAYKRMVLCFCNCMRRLKESEHYLDHSLCV